MLTRKQQLLLKFIHQRLQSEGVPPSFEEMKDALALKSKSGIHRLITALEERGFIRRLPNRARALEVVKMPESWGAPDAAAGEAGDAAVIRPDFGAKTGVAANSVKDNVTPFPGMRETAQKNFSFNVPVMGKIAAGVPICAIEDNTHCVAVPQEMLGSGDHFALTVEGDSMIDAGIHDGDTVLIRQNTTATPGDIVVALVDDEEATLKTYHRRNGEIALEAANSAYETRMLSPDRVKVQGKLVGLLRQYH